MSNVNSQETLINELKRHKITHVLMVPLPNENWAQIDADLRREDFQNEAMFHEIRLRRLLFEFLQNNAKLLFESEDAISQGGRLLGTKNINKSRVYRIFDLSSR